MAGIEAWNGHEETTVLHDADTGVTVAIVVHRRRERGAMGGFRIVTGGMPWTDVFGLACRLASIMTVKAFWSGIRSVGGMKIVARLPGDTPDHRRRAVDLVARYLCDRPLLFTGKDLGIGHDDLVRLAEKAPGHVVGLDPHRDPSAWTARGVAIAIRHLAFRVLGAQRRPRVLVEGLGAVGGRLAEMLVEEGCVVHGVDPSEDAARAAERSGVAIVGRCLTDVREGTYDVLAPCAGPRSVGVDTCTRLGVRIVCGAANDPYVDAEGLHGIGVVCAPDPIVNRGGLCVVASEIDHTIEPEERITAIPRDLDEVFGRAKTAGMSPVRFVERFGR